MKKIPLIIITIMFLFGCATLDEHAERTWREDMKEWVAAQNKKCPIKVTNCSVMTSVACTSRMLIYNIEVSGSIKCKYMVEDIKASTNVGMEKVARKKIGNKVALMHVSIKYCFWNEQGSLINSFVIYGGD